MKNINYERICTKIVRFVNLKGEKLSCRTFCEAMLPDLGRCSASRLFLSLVANGAFVSVSTTNFKKIGKPIDWFVPDNIRDIFLQQNILHSRHHAGRIKGRSTTAQIVERLDKLDRFLENKRTGDLISTIVDLGLQLSESGINVIIESGKITFYK